MWWGGVETKIRWQTRRFVDVCISLKREMRERPSCLNIHLWDGGGCCKLLQTGLVISFFLTTPPYPDKPPCPTPESLKNVHFDPFQSVSGPFRVASGKSWGVGWCRGGVVERGCCGKRISLDWLANNGVFEGD